MAEPASSSAAAGVQASADSANVEEILAGEKILLVEHFPDPVAELLVQLIKQLGATTVTSRSDATISLVNPRSPHAAKEAEVMALFAKSYPDISHPVIYPYHWLAHCFHARRRVDPPEAPVIFVHPDRSRDHAPLKVWISVNLHRHTNETAQMAQAETVRNVELHGGLKVTKRSQADLLIVDPESQFYRTQIMPERVKAGRAAWQRVGEREWVEACIRDGLLEWRTIEETEGDKEVDSMAEDEPVPAGKGPGRPTGKPRVDYSPEDDDFLCRYLAFYHPKGSWHSRKTYETMVTMAEMYPLIGRHSHQSWHERFKKNATAFSSRILRLKDQGLDDTLKTQTERQKELERRRKRIEKTVQQSTGTEAGSSDEAARSSPAQQNGGTPRRGKGKGRRARESPSQEQAAPRPDTDGPNPVPEPAAEAQQPAPISTTEPAVAVDRTADLAARPTVDHRPSEATASEPAAAAEQSSAPTAAEPAVEAQQQPAPATTEPAAEIQPTSQSTTVEPLVEKEQKSSAVIVIEQVSEAIVVEPVVENQQGETPAVPDSEMEVEQSAAPIVAQPAPEVQQLPEAAISETAVEAQQPSATIVIEPVVEAQQLSTAIMFEPAVEAEWTSATTRDETAVEVQQLPTPIVAESAVEESQPPANTGEIKSSAMAASTEQPEVEVVAESVVGLVPASVIIAQETVLEISKSPDTEIVNEIAATQAMDIVESETQRILAAFAQAGSPKRPLEKTPITQLNRESEPVVTANEAVRDSSHASTPKRKKARLSTMAEALTASARKRSEVRDIPAKPDQVLAFTREPIPGAPRQAPEPFSRSPVKRKTPEPPLSREQFAKEVLNGRDIALAAKELYRKRILEYCQKYRVKPLDLVKVLDGMPKNLRRSSSGGGETYWSDVQRCLAAHFGF